jgi:hypothetical protein
MDGGGDPAEAAMALTIEDPETLALVEQMASRWAIGPEAAVRLALQSALFPIPARSSGFAEDRPPTYRPEPRVLTEEEKAEGWRKLRAIHEEMKKYPPTGLVADDAFYDSISDV